MVISVAIVMGIVISYFFGSISYAKIIGDRKGVDLSKKGSGNLGSTNTLRNLGWKAGLANYLLDILKGFIPVFLGWILFLKVLNTPPGGRALFLIGFASFLGHVYSFFLRNEERKGGKGAATAMGVCLAMNIFAGLSWLVFIIPFAAWILILVATKGTMSVATLVAAFDLAVSALIFGKDSAVAMGFVLMSSVIIYKHKDNIKRLIDGTELKMRRKEV